MARRLLAIVYNIYFNNENMKLCVKKRCQNVS